MGQSRNPVPAFLDSLATQGEVRGGGEVPGLAAAQG